MEQRVAHLHQNHKRQSNKFSTFDKRRTMALDVNCQAAKLKLAQHNDFAL
jgi:hypothetical protein